MIICAFFVVCVRSVEILDKNLCQSLVCSSGKKAFKHCKEYFVNGCLKQDEVPENGVFHTLEKAFSILAPGPPLSGFLAFLNFHLSTVPGAPCWIYCTATNKIIIMEEGEGGGGREKGKTGEKK